MYDALEKKYLQNIIFSIYLDQTNELDAVEIYTFSFSYTENNKVKMDFASSHSDNNKTSNTTSYIGMNYWISFFMPYPMKKIFFLIEIYLFF